MALLPDKIVVAAMELVVEAENTDLETWEYARYVGDRLKKRFPTVGPLTVDVIANEMLDSRNRGLW